MGTSMTHAICTVFCCFGMVARTFSGAGNEYNWGYTGAHDPRDWHNHYPHCGGMRQSPINIVMGNVVFNSKLGNITLLGYSRTLSPPPQLVNNGHSAQVNIKGDYFIEGGGLPSKYRVAQFHFHWGDADRRGSEHYIDGKPFPMEMHIVHYSTEYFNISEAMNRPNGLAVLTVFFEIGNSPNEAFQKVISHFDSAAHKDEATMLEPFALRSLLPRDVTTFYRYAGSLTTPPCYESVIWTLYKDYVTLSESQIDKFRTVLKSSTAADGNDVQLVNDFRPIQPLHARLVETNTKNAASTSERLTVTRICLAMLLLIDYLCVNM